MSEIQRKIATHNIVALLSMEDFAVGEYAFVTIIMWMASYFAVVHVHHQVCL